MVFLQELFGRVFLRIFFCSICLLSLLFLLQNVGTALSTHLDTDSYDFTESGTVSKGFYRVAVRRRCHRR